MNKAATILVLGNGSGAVLFTGTRTSGRAHGNAELEVNALRQELEKAQQSECFALATMHQQEVDNLVETAGLTRDLAIAEERLQSSQEYINELQRVIHKRFCDSQGRILELQADVAEVTEQRDIIMAQRDTLANEILDLHQQLAQVTDQRTALGNEFIAQSVELARMTIECAHLKKLLHRITGMTVISVN